MILTRVWLGGPSVRSAMLKAGRTRKAKGGAVCHSIKTTARQEAREGPLFLLPQLSDLYTSLYGSDPSVEHSCGSLCSGGVEGDTSSMLMQRIGYVPLAETPTLDSVSATAIKEPVLEFPQVRGEVGASCAPRLSTNREHGSLMNSGSDGERTYCEADIRVALLHYSPILEEHIIRRVSEAVDIPGAFSRAQKLLQLLQEVGTDGFLRVLRMGRMADEEYPRQREELRAGIAAQLHAMRMGQRLKAFILQPSDIQANEVLPNGRVVTFTAPTVPDAVDSEEGTSQLTQLLQAAVQHTDDGVNAIYFHFVLYRECVSLPTVFAHMCRATDGALQGDDFAVNIVEMEAGVAVQTCSARIALNRLETKAVTGGNEAALRAKIEDIARSIIRLNLRALPFSVQMLTWRPFGCSPLHVGHCQVQYSILLRGIQRGRGSLEAAAQECASCMPNYYPPSFFGPLPCNFRSYHISAALEQHRYREALLMAACLGASTAGEGSLPWIGNAFSLLMSEECRAGVLKEWFHLHVPSSFQKHLAHAKGALLCNSIISCRVHELRTKRTAWLTALPEVGDFVFTADEEGSRRSTSAGASATHAVYQTDVVPSFFQSMQPGTRESEGIHVRERGKSTTWANVMPLVSETEVAPFTVSNVLIPFCSDDCPIMDELACRIGFAATEHTMKSGRASVSFRHLLTHATGYPHSHRPWVRAFTEPSEIAAEVVATDGASTPVDAVYHLCTDLQLSSAVATTRNYTERSRGQRSGVWPIGRRGNTMLDRLPAGLLAATAADNGMQSASRRSSRCVALHFTLPANASCLNLLREFVILDGVELVYETANGTLGENVKRDTGKTENTIHIEVPVSSPVSDSTEEPTVDGNIMAMSGCSAHAPMEASPEQLH